MKDKRIRLISRYYGGKGTMIDYILSQFPVNYFEMNYLEVFGGGGSVLAKKFPSQAEIYNDINTEMTRYLKVIQTDVVSLARKAAHCFDSGELLMEYVRDDPTQYDDLERAWRWMYVNNYSLSGLNFSWHGVSGWNKDNAYLPGKLKQPGEYKDNNKRDLYKIIRYLYRYSNRYRNVAIYNKDFRTMIQHFDAANVMAYLDPPYFAKGHNYKKMYGYPEYVKVFDYDDHLALAKQMREMKGRFVLSIDNCKEADEVYGEFYKFEFDVSYTASHFDNITGKEAIFRNFTEIMGDERY